MLTPACEAADRLGGGVGQVIGEGFKASFGVYGSFHLAHGALERLTAIEYETEADGTCGSGPARASVPSRRGREHRPDCLSTCGSVNTGQARSPGQGRSDR
jgi:hypothetical protein